jgi:2-polyprenyl-3-methyl-5-hydroxy-6-metoxy-1,4-benzoquinol methylase
MGKIFDVLESLNLASKDTSEIFSESTRDIKNLKVYKDRSSEVIYIDDFFVGDHVYNEGAYRETESTALTASYEDIADGKRRAADFIDLYSNKVICDFGCGEGTFLLNTIKSTKKSYGVEIQENCIKKLNRNNIDCYNNIGNLKDNSLDSCFMFHVLEHLEDPTYHLNQLKFKLVSGGKIIIEVPHARDFLIKNLNIQEFIDFTLWSQHLILHTRHSLEAFLIAAGYKNIKIHGVQRFSIANHIQWAKDKKPGGHRGDLAVLEMPDLVKAYQEALNLIDATDTLIAIAEK